jgi:hypothetical protein
MINAAISLLFMAYYETLATHLQSFADATTRFVIYLAALGIIALAIRTYKKRSA